MEGYWPIFFLLVVLKVPAIAMIYLLYWAATNEPANGVADEGEDGGNDRRPPRPLFPRGPRRGPHGGDALTAPRRTRSAGLQTGHRVPVGRGQPEPAKARERKPARSLERERSF